MTLDQGAADNRPDLAANLAALAEELAATRKTLGELAEELEQVKATLAELQAPNEVPANGHTVVPPVVASPKPDERLWLQRLLLA